MGALTTLLWKGLILKRRSWKSALLEITVPMLIFIAIILCVPNDNTWYWGHDSHVQTILPNHNLNAAAEINNYDTVNMTKVRFGYVGSPETYEKLRTIIGDTRDHPFLEPFTSESQLRAALGRYSGTYRLGLVEHESGHNAHYSLISIDQETVGFITRTPWTVFDRSYFTATGFYGSSPYLLVEGLRIIALHRSGAVRFNPEGRFPTMDEASAALTSTVVSLPLTKLDVNKALIDLTILVCCVLFVGFALIYLQTLTSLVSEKENRIAELMRTMGVTRFDIVAAWWVVQLGMAVTSAVLVSVAALAGTYNHISPFIVLLLYLSTACTFVTVAIALSPLFTSVRAAQLIGAVLFLVMFVCAYFSSLEAPSGVIKTLCLIPGVGFFLGVRIVLNFVSISEYFPVSQMTSPVFNTSLATVITFTLIGLVGFAIAGLYLNLVVPSGFDAPLPWHFPFSTPYNALRTLRKNSAASTQAAAAAARADAASAGSYLALNDDPGSEHSVVSSINSANVSRPSDVEALFAAGPRVRPGACIASRPPAAMTDANGNVLPSTPPPVVQLRSLRREFRTGAPAAVRCLDLDIHRGELVALLGRSGAGKSTVLAMIAGTLAPTSGWVRICGQDITVGGGTSVGLVGVCPQDNALYDGLTVADHLDLFARLKGISSSDLRMQAVLNWADRIGLGPGGDNKLDSVVKDLSGGQKRKLCLAMAFIGDPQLVILDEPTAGLDFSAQRSVRELLHSERHSRAILISTHSMEEAEVCDRVVILAEGSLQCAGPPAFLKHEFGAGYTLTVTKVVDKTPVSKAVDSLEEDDDSDDNGEDGVNDSPVLSSKLSLTNEEGFFEDDAAVFTTDSGRLIFKFLRSIIPGLHPTRDVVGDVCFSLPASSSSSLPAALLALDAAPAELGVGSYTVAVTSLDDVFRRVSEDARVVDDADATLPAAAAANAAHTDTLIRAGSRAPSSTWAGGQDPLLIPHDQLRRDPAETQKWELRRQLSGYDDGADGSNSDLGRSDLDMPMRDMNEGSQWGSDYEYRRLYPGVPFTKMLWALYSKHARSAVRESLSLRWQVLTPVLIILASSLLSWAIQKTEAQFVPLSLSLFASPRAIDMPVINGEHDTIASYRSTLVPAFAASEFGTQVDKPQVTVDRDVCSEPSALDSFYYQRLEHKPRNFFRPFTIVPCEVREFPPTEGSSETTVVHDIIYVNSTANHPLPIAHVSAANAWMHAAHVAQNKPGPPPTLRVDHHDILTFRFSTPLRISSLMIMVYGIVLAALVFISGIGVVRERALGSMHLQFVSGAPRSAYWLSHLLWELTLSLSHLGAIFICLTMFDMWGVTESRAWLIAPGYLAYVVASIPVSYFASFLAAKAEYAQTTVLLTNAAVMLVASMLAVLPVANAGYFSTLIACLSSVTPTLAFIMFLPWVYFGFSDMPMRVYGAEDYTPLLILVGNVVLMWAVLFCIEADSMRNFRSRVKRALTNTTGDELSDEELAAPVDPDVAREEELILSGGCENAFSFPVVIRGLRKVFSSKNGPFIAVSNLSFAVSRGQCFGFLGANGAGKSTTMRMLTGDERPTAGVARINGFDTEWDRAVASMLTGYCPQSDAFFPCLTPRENLRFFAVLRGISDFNISRHVGELLTRTGLAGVDADVAAELLSVGNRRKLSVAIALIGNPPVVILDEPTAGIDPRARHEIWSLVSSTMANRSVILTTHSMEECEALCDRIGIMSGGVMRCIGVPSTVKTTHGSGYACSVSLANEADADKAEAYITSALRGSRCVSRNGATLSFHIPSSLGKTLADVFSTLESGRDYGIGTYSACSSNLGDVFENVIRSTSCSAPAHAA